MGQELADTYKFELLSLLLKWKVKIETIYFPIKF